MFLMLQDISVCSNVCTEMMLNTMFCADMYYVFAVIFNGTK